MMTFQRKHVLAAIKDIRENGLPDGNRDSTKWDLIDPNTNERFPPKAITRIARTLAGQSVDNWPSGGPATNEPLRKLGFQIVRKDDGAEVDADLVKDIENVAKSNSDPTTKHQLIEARLGQGKFRHSLLERWNEKCPITKCNLTAALRASHIKPWRESTDEERLDPSNGLLLAVSIDALFDRHLLTFDSDGSMMVARAVNGTQLDILGIPVGKTLKLKANGKVYMAHHRAVFTAKHGARWYTR